MIPVIAIVGRPNVGKSTLFNRLTRSQQALVVDEPGVTRDRQFGQGECNDQSYIVIDTGGILEDPQDEIESATVKQSLQAVKEAHVLFFVVDGRQGLTHFDRQLANELRKQDKPVFLVINKTDGLQAQVAAAEFYQLGFDLVYPIAASHNQGIEPLLEDALACIELPPVLEEEVIEREEKHIPKVALVGRPNVGKSTLANRMLGEERVIVCDYPGTTRDSIYIEMQRMGKHYTLIDTAGVRRKKNVTQAVEKFSIIKTLQAIKDADVVLLVLDARAGVSDQDLRLIDFVIEAGRSLIILANKWDGMSDEDREQFKNQVTYRLRFAQFASVYYISALHGSGVGDIFGAIDDAYKSAHLALDTSELSKMLEDAITAHPPPLVHGRRIKLRYAHCGGHNPLVIVIHGNQTEDLPLSYQRYLSKYFIKALNLESTPVKIICKSGENPYAGKRNTLTPRQAYKRKRLMDYVKKQAKRKRKKKKE